MIQVMIKKYVYSVIWYNTQLAKACSESGLSCRNLERVVLVSESTVYHTSSFNSLQGQLAHTFGRIILLIVLILMVLILIHSSG